jgi:hypothetical protein
MTSLSEMPRTYLQQDQLAYPLPTTSIFPRMRATLSVILGAETSQRQLFWIHAAGAPQ